MTRSLSIHGSSAGRERDGIVRRIDSAILAQVRAALRRIDNGTYGRCVVDGEPIDAKRLESVPWTPCCLKHQLEFEERARIRTPSL